jgi:hypothetical protein
MKKLVMKKNDWLWLALIFAVLLVASVSVYLEWSVWKECRQTNSFWYCVRMMSNH